MHLPNLTFSKVFPMSHSLSGPFLVCSLLFTSIYLQGQSVLWQESFDGCAPPSDWIINLDGNQDAIWYVGTPQNANSDGSSIDGTCMLILDDDATGDQTPAWTLSMQTPTFDGTGFSDLRLTADIHFRNYDELVSLKVSVWDGEQYHLLKTYQTASTQTGEQFSEFETFSADLSFYAAPEMHLLIEYDDGNSWGWWAGIDNLLVIGEGTASNVVLENFNGCETPDGWETEIISGDNNWQFGFMDNPNAYDANSMNGSCFAFFDDDILGADAASSTVRLTSPVFDGTEYAHYTLEFDAILRRFEDLESLDILVSNGEEIQNVTSYLYDLGGPQLNQYLNVEVDLSPYRSEEMQVIFQYTDGSGWGWWTGIDNVKISGEGISNDQCTQAILVELDAPCLEGDNETAIFAGPESNCSENAVGSLWYQYESTSSGYLEVKSNARFNDVITAFQGPCDNLSTIQCLDWNEHGFAGEVLRLEVEAGLTYYFRVHGKEKAFGLPRGSLCFELVSIDALPEQPANDLCIDAQVLEYGQNCLSGETYFAGTEGPQPSIDNRARHEIWYQFSAPSIGPFEIRTNSDFADAAILLEGACDALVELASSDKGQQLTTPELIPGQTYYLQLSGAFASLEGSLCVEVVLADPITPPNDECAQAIPVALNTSCTPGSNLGASFSEATPSCEPYPSASIWYEFVAPASGSVFISTGAEFLHTAAIYGGNCDELEEVQCVHHPNTCEGPWESVGLSPGATYYLQIAAANQYYNFENEGTTCVQIWSSDQYEAPEPVQLFANVNCVVDGLGQLEIVISGAENYQIIGNTTGEFLQTGDFYMVIIQAPNGCEWSVSGVVDCGGTSCGFTTTSSQTDVTCYGGEDGSGAVAIDGPNGPYEITWPDGTTGNAQDDLPAGLYILTVTDNAGCTGAAAVEVMEPEAFQVSIDSILGSTIGQESGAIFITPHGATPPYSFEWTQMGVVISTDQNPTGLGGGDYELLLSDANGCTYQTSYNVPVFSSAEEVLVQTQLAIYPNPSSGPFNIEFSQGYPEPFFIEIFAADGRSVSRYYKFVPSAQVLDLNFGRLAAGTYQLQISGNGLFETHEMVLTR